MLLLASALFSLIPGMDHKPGRSTMAGDCAAPQAGLGNVCAMLHSVKAYRELMPRFEEWLRGGDQAVR